MIVSGVYGNASGMEFADRDERDEAGRTLTLRWRDSEGKRVERLVKDYEPYIYVEHGATLVVKAYDGVETPIHVDDLPSHILTKSRVDRVEQTTKVSKDGKRLVKVHLKTELDHKGFSQMKWFERNVRGKNRLVEGTYEADVRYNDRYMVDHIHEIPEYKMRKLFIDLEALQYRRGEVDDYAVNENNPRENQSINAIGVYDSYSKMYIQWTYHNSLTEESRVEEFDGKKCVVHYFDNEVSMMKSFVKFVDEVDPDCLLAWGGHFYDFSTLYYRLQCLGIGAEMLSPSSLGKYRHMKHPTSRGRLSYSDSEQPITGRLCISLDLLFKRVYMDSKSSKISGKLDVVGQTLFGRGKTDFRPDFYDKNYDEFLDDFLYYNFRDVELMVEIEEKYRLIEGQQALQNLAKCSFESTLAGSHLARVYFMRKAPFIQNTGWQTDFSEEDEDLQGAIIMDPEEMGTIGLHKNVVILDYAGLYPSVMKAFNTSWETKVPPGQERDDDIIGDGCRFRKNPVGILPACVDELDDLRNEYKDNRQVAAEQEGKTSDEYNKWDDAQKTVKRLRATFYGLMGFGRKGYAWGDIDIARTITYGGRQALRKIEDECNKMGYQVIYGHTDSIFVKLGDEKSIQECAQISIELGERLTEIVQKHFDTDALEVEAELLMDRFYLPRRNKYAGRIVWQPGTGASPFDIMKEAIDDRIKMQGLDARFANTANITRRIQKESLKLIWDERPNAEVVEYINSEIQKVRDKDCDLEDLIAGARLGQWLPPTSVLQELKAGKEIEVDVLDENGVPTGEKESVSPAAVHYGAGATNPRARPDDRGFDKCFTQMRTNERAAAWYNIVLATEDLGMIDRGEGFYTIYVLDGPTWIPVGGGIGFFDIEEIEAYTIDYEKIIEKNIIAKIDHIMYGIGLSNDIFRVKTADEEFKKLKFRAEDFS